MRAILVGADRALNWGWTPDLTPGPGEVRIAVTHTAVNRADLLQRLGLYDPPPGAGDVLGLECAGAIDSVGEGVAEWAVGDRVCALLAGGGYAEQVVVPAGQLLPIPEGMRDQDAAGLPEVFATAFLNLFGEAGMKEGHHVLIHAGASGVGTAAIQLCAISGSPCWVTAGSDEKIARCVALGADGGTNRHEADFGGQVRAWSPGGVDVILDPVGGNYLAANQALLRTDGRLVIIGLLGGRRGELDLGRMLVKRQRVIGSTLRSRSAESKAALIARMRRAIWPLFETGELFPVIDRVVPITEAEAAFEAIKGNDTVGKVVLRVR